MEILLEEGLLKNEPPIFPLAHQPDCFSYCKSQVVMRSPIKLDHQILKNRGELFVPYSSANSLTVSPFFSESEHVLHKRRGCTLSHLLRTQRKVVLKTESPDSLAPAGCVNLDEAFGFFVYCTVTFLQLLCCHIQLL